MRHEPKPVITPDAADFVRIFIDGLQRAGLQSRGGVTPERVTLNVVFIELLADDLWIYAERDDPPDLIDVAARCITLLICRFEDLEELPYVIVEALEILAEDNGAVADLADEEAIADFRLMVDYLDTDEASHQAVLRLWLRRRMFLSSDDEEWSPPPAPDEAEELAQLTLDGLWGQEEEPSQPLGPRMEADVDPDPDLLALLLPPDDMPRAFIAGAMTGLPERESAEVHAAAGFIAAWLRDHGFKVHEPTAVVTDNRPDSTVEAVDLDRLAETDVLFVLGDPGATGTGIVLGKAMHTDPVRVVFVHPGREVTPLLDHVTATGGAIYRTCDEEGLRSRLENFVATYQEAIQRRVHRRLGWARYSRLHAAFVSALRGARLVQPLSSAPVSAWRLSQLERSLHHFAQAGFDELRDLADWLRLPSWCRAELAGIEPTTIDASEPQDGVPPSSPAPRGEVFSAREVLALVAVQKADNRPEDEFAVLLARAERRRIREDSLAVAGRWRAKLDESGWRQLRGVTDA